MKNNRKVICLNHDTSSRRLNKRGEVSFPVTKRIIALLFFLVKKTIFYASNTKFLFARNYVRAYIFIIYLYYIILYYYIFIYSSKLLSIPPPAHPNPVNGTMGRWDAGRFV